MGWLAAQGAIMLVGLAIGLVCMVVSLFVGHIIIFDSIALGIASGGCCNYFFTLHPALCLLVGAAVFAALLFLQNTRFGFWIIGVLLSAVWAFIFAFFAYIFAGEDMIWFYVVLALGFLLMIALHIHAKSKE